MFVNSVIDITPTDVCASFRLVNSPVGVVTRRKNREKWAVALKRSGKTVYTVNHKEYVSDKTHPVILPRGCSYSWRCVEPGECLIIEFNAADAYIDIFNFTVSDNTFFVNAFSRIERLLNGDNPSRKLECVYQLYGILVSLFKTVKKDYVSKEKKAILQPAVDYISENYANGHITNDYLAHLCSVSTVYFRKLFESVYGVSPIKYLNNLRINKAKNMLTSDYESINQIAESVGYNSIYHFSKMFNAHTGMSPSEYAKTSRK